MRWILLAILLAGAAGSAVASEPETIRVVARDEGHDHAWFEVEGLEGIGPTIVLAAGSTVRFVLENRGSVEHNLHLGEPVVGVTRLVPPGEERELVVEVPANASGTALYWCDPHRQVGMSGTIRFAAPPPSPSPVATPSAAASPTPEDPKATPLGAMISIFAFAAGGHLIKDRRRHR